MIFLDINTFFSPKAGGIRTYHQAKLSWFRAQARHRYCLVYPGPARRSSGEGPVTLEEAYGPAMTPDPQGYRLLVDYWRVFRIIRRLSPAVLEAGDPWFTGLFCLLLRRLGLYRGLLISFYHSDPVPSYFEPWAAGRPGRRGLARLAAQLFYRLQRAYALTVVSSRAMEAALRSRGVTRVVRMPFGVAPLFLDGPPARTPPRGEIRVLYAGRLDREKGVDLLLDCLPGLLARAEVRLTVAGRGAYAARFAAVEHARFRYLGFLDDPRAMRDLYDSHHVLVAPGPFETFGLGVLEAMARGLVVVGPDRGGTGELLREAESPFLFPAGDGDGFRRALLAALDCDWEREAARAQALARGYGSWDQAVGRMVEHYQALAPGRPA